MSSDDEEYEDDEEEYEEEDDEDDEVSDRRVKKRRRKLEKHEVLQLKVQRSNMPKEWKAEALDKIEAGVSCDGQKAFEWVEKLLKFPIGQYAKLPVSIKSNEAQIKKYFKRVENTLEKAVYGMKTVKEEIMNYIAQIISTNNKTKPRVLGLCGSPGIGKTAIIRRGLAQALNRPISCMSMGGIRDSNYFIGHDYTYIGSRPGIIVQNIIKLGFMNGIIFMDEVDKISSMYDGADVQNLLMHMTDPEQNHTFQDKYFAGIEFDLSRIVFVFSYNDSSRLDPILRDRIYEIKVPDPSFEEKIVIGTKYLLKELAENIGLREDDVVFSNDVTAHILRHYCKRQKGVRQLKKCLETVLLKLNTARFTGMIAKYKTIQNVKFPMKVSVEMIDEMLSEMKDPMDMYLLSMFI